MLRRNSSRAAKSLTGAAEIGRSPKIALHLLQCLLYNPRGHLKCPGNRVSTHNQFCPVFVGNFSNISPRSAPELGCWSRTAAVSHQLPVQSLRCQTVSTEYRISRSALLQVGEPAGKVGLQLRKQLCYSVFFHGQQPSGLLRQGRCPVTRMRWLYPYLSAVQSLSEIQNRLECPLAYFRLVGV